MSDDPEYARDLAKIRESDLEQHPEALSDWHRKARFIALTIFSLLALAAFAVNFLHWP